MNRQKVLLSVEKNVKEFLLKKKEDLSRGSGTERKVLFGEFLEGLCLMRDFHLDLSH